MRVVLVIPGDPPPTLNQQERMFWAKRSRLRDVLAEQAWVAWNQSGRPVFGHPDVTVRVYYRYRRRRDLDNVTGGIKPILDGLKGYAFRDDDSETIRLHVEILVDKANPRVEIELVEREEAA